MLSISTLRRSLGASAFLVLLMVPDLIAQNRCGATEGVAIPVRHMVSQGECEPARPQMDELELVKVQIDKGNAATREYIHRTVGDYESRSEAIRTADERIDIARGLPGWKAIPLLDEYVGVVKDRLTDRARQVNRDTYHDRLRSIYARALVENPELRDRPFARAELLEEVARRVAPEDYAAVGAIAQAEMSKELGEIEGDLEVLRKALVPQIRGLEQQGKTLKEIQDRLTDAEGEALDLDQGLNMMKEDLAQLRETMGELDANVGVAVRVQEEVIKRERQIMQTVEEHQARVAENERTIRSNRHEMTRLRKLGKTNAGVILQLSALQSETSALASENAQRLDAVSAVLYKNVDAAGKLELLRSGAHTVPDQEKTEAMLESSAQISKFETAVSVGEGVVDAAVALGLDPEDAQRAREGLAAVQLGLGLARLYIGDYTAIASVAQSAGQLFGGSSEPDPFQSAVMAQFDHLNKRLDVLFERVDTLGVRMDTLLARQTRYQVALLDEIAFLDARIDFVDAKLDYLIERWKEQGNPNCLPLGGSEADLLLRRLSDADSMSEIIHLHEREPLVRRIRDCLFTFLTAAELGDQAFLHYTGADELTKRYDEVLNQRAALGPRPAIERIASGTCRDDRLYDPVAAMLLAELALEMDPILYFEGGDARLTTPSEMTTPDHQFRQGAMSERYKKLGEVIACTMAQQSLISGGSLYGEPILNYVKAAVTEAGIPAHHQDYARNVLRSEFSILHVNLAGLLLRARFMSTWSLYDDLEQAEKATERPEALLHRLNLALTDRELELTWYPEFGLALMVRATLNGEIVERALPVPPAARVRMGKPIYLGVVDRLASLYSHVVERQHSYDLSLHFSGLLLSGIGVEAELDFLAFPQEASSTSSQAEGSQP